MVALNNTDTAVLSWLTPRAHVIVMVAGERRTASVKAVEGHALTVRVLEPNPVDPERDRWRYATSTLTVDIAEVVGVASAEADAAHRRARAS